MTTTNKPGGAKASPLFTNEDAAREYFERRLWPDGPVCPRCGSGDRLAPRANGLYRCNGCRRFEFSLKTNTAMERSKVPYRVWMHALSILKQEPKIGTQELARRIAWNLKTTYFMRSRLVERAGARLLEIAP